MTANHLSLKPRLVLGHLYFPLGWASAGSTILSFVSPPSPVVLLHLLSSSFCSCAPLGCYLPLFMLLPYFPTNQSSVGQFLVGISFFQELPNCFKCTPEADSCSPLPPENQKTLPRFLQRRETSLQNVALVFLLSPQLPVEFRTPQVLVLFLSYLISLFLYWQGFL